MSPAPDTGGSPGGSCPARGDRGGSAARCSARLLRRDSGCCSGSGTLLVAEAERCSLLPEESSSRSRAAMRWVRWASAALALSWAPAEAIGVVGADMTPAGGPPLGCLDSAAAGSATPACRQVHGGLAGAGKEATQWLTLPQFAQRHRSACLSMHGDKHRHQKGTMPAAKGTGRSAGSVLVPVVVANYSLACCPGRQACICSPLGRASVPRLGGVPVSELLRG